MQFVPAFELETRFYNNIFNRGYYEYDYIKYIWYDLLSINAKIYSYTSCLSDNIRCPYKFYSRTESVHPPPQIQVSSSPSPTLCRIYTDINSATSSHVRAFPRPVSSTASCCVCDVVTSFSISLIHVYTGRSKFNPHGTHPLSTEHFTFYLLIQCLLFYVIIYKLYKPIICNNQSKSDVNSFEECNNQCNCVKTNNPKYKNHARILDKLDSCSTPICNSDLLSFSFSSSLFSLSVSLEVSPTVMMVHDSSDEPTIEVDDTGDTQLKVQKELQMTPQSTPNKRKQRRCDHQKNYFVSDEDEDPNFLSVSYQCISGTGMRLESQQKRIRTLSQTSNGSTYSQSNVKKTSQKLISDDGLYELDRAKSCIFGYMIELLNTDEAENFYHELNSKFETDPENTTLEFTLDDMGKFTKDSTDSNIPDELCQMVDHYANKVRKSAAAIFQIETSIYKVLIKKLEGDKQHIPYQSYPYYPKEDDSHDTTVSIVSLGSPRPLLLKTISGRKVTHQVPLHSGSLCMMSGSTQQKYQHSIPKATASPSDNIYVFFIGSQLSDNSTRLSAPTSESDEPNSVSDTDTASVTSLDTEPGLTTESIYTHIPENLLLKTNIPVVNIQHVTDPSDAVFTQTPTENSYTDTVSAETSAPPSVLTSSNEHQTSSATMAHTTEHDESDRTMIKVNKDSDILLNESLVACIMNMPEKQIHDELKRHLCSVTGTLETKRNRLIVQVFKELSRLSPQPSKDAKENSEKEFFYKYLAGVERTITEQVGTIDRLTAEISSLKDEFASLKQPLQKSKKSDECTTTKDITAELKDMADLWTKTAVTMDQLRTGMDMINIEMVKSQDEVLEVDAMVRRTKADLEGWYNSAFFHEDTKMLQEIHGFLVKRNDKEDQHRRETEVPLNSHSLFDEFQDVYNQSIKQHEQSLCCTTMCPGVRPSTQMSSSTSSQPLVVNQSHEPSQSTRSSLANSLPQRGPVSDDNVQESIATDSNRLKDNPYYPLSDNATADCVEQFITKESQIDICNRILNQLNPDIPFIKSTTKFFQSVNPHELDKSTSYTHTFQNRQVAYYGDYDYSYSGIIHKARGINQNKELNTIFEALQDLFPSLGINSALINCYRSYDSGMPFHSDRETEIDKNTPIISVSFGESRQMYFRRRNSNSIHSSILLEHGDLLAMSAKSQELFEHSIPSQMGTGGTFDDVDMRISITFRKINKQPGSHNNRVSNNGITRAPSLSTPTCSLSSFPPISESVPRSPSKYAHPATSKKINDSSQATRRPQKWNMTQSAHFSHPSPSTKAWGDVDRDTRQNWVDKGWSSTDLTGHEPVVFSQRRNYESISSQKQPLNQSARNRPVQQPSVYRATVNQIPTRTQPTMNLNPPYQGVGDASDQRQRNQRRSSINNTADAAPQRSRVFTTVLITDSIMKSVPLDALGTNHKLHILHKGDSNSLGKDSLLKRLEWINPDFVYVHLGINDICGRYPKSNDITLSQFKDFSSYLSRNLPNTRLIYSLPLRTDDRFECDAVTDLTRRLINLVNVTNGSSNTLQCKVLFNTNSNFETIQGGQTIQTPDLFSQDGIHLTAGGSLQIIRNFRHVIHDLTRRILNKHRRQ